MFRKLANKFKRTKIGDKVQEKPLDINMGCALLHRDGLWYVVDESDPNLYRLIGPGNLQ